MSVTQLSPSIPVMTPKGLGLAWFLLDYSEEHHLFWIVAIDDTGEIWTFPNPEVRAVKNVTMGRNINKTHKDEFTHSAPYMNGLGQAIPL